MSAEMPAKVRREVEKLGAEVDRVVPARAGDNVLIATWNLRGFGGVTEKWAAGEGDSPKRDWRSIALIAAIVRRFDVVAIQEQKRETAALRRLLAELGSDWRVIASDVTEGTAGNHERLAYLYDSSRVLPSGLVGEIVLPPAAGDPTRQFVRTPYCAGFRRGDTEFILTTVHIIWASSESPERRVPELAAFARWMRDWAEQPNDWNENLLVLGDFNIDRHGSQLWQELTATGLGTHADLNKLPRTIFAATSDDGFYDQIAWFSSEDDKKLLLTSMAPTGQMGNIDFVDHCYREFGTDRTALSWRISDHYPLWIEFRTT